MCFKLIFEGKEKFSSFLVLYFFLREGIWKLYLFKGVEFF